jgi:hypothetical protein
VVDDSVHHGIVGDEGNDLNRASALGTDHRRPGTHTEFKRIRNMSPIYSVPLLICPLLS